MDKAAPSPVLTPALRTRLHPAWLARLRSEWQLANRDHLGGVLRLPVLGIDVAATARVGLWQRSARALTLSEMHILTAPWTEVVVTLRHEMAHQFVDEVLGVRDESAHGPAFAEACRRLQIDARASADATALAPAVQKVLDKVKKLLALAESHNVHEAEAAMAHANRLLLEFNLDPAVTATPAYRWQRIGRSAAALGIDAKLVGAILSEFFFVECIWVSVYQPLLDRDERQLEILGDRHNLELAHYVHDFLHREVERLWQLERPKWAGQGRTARRDYVSGVLLGFRDKLRAERRGSAERGLVWVGDPQLKVWLRDRYPRISSMASSGVGASDAHAAGRAAGHDLRIHHGVGTTVNHGKLLGR